MHFCTFAFKILICWNYYFIFLLVYLDYAIISYEIWKQKAQPRLCIRKHQWNTQSDFKGRSKTPHSDLKKSLPKELKKQTIKQKVNLKRHLSSELHPTSRTFGNQSDDQFRRQVERNPMYKRNIKSLNRRSTRHHPTREVAGWPSQGNKSRRQTLPSRGHKWISPKDMHQTTASKQTRNTSVKHREGSSSCSTLIKY